MRFRQFLKTFFAEHNLDGEYWITDGGEVMYADGDIGDYNHEAHVIETLQHQIMDHFGIYDDPPYDWDEVKEQIVEEILNSTDPQNQAAWQQLAESNPDQLIATCLQQQGYPNAEEALYTANGGGDAREYAMEHWGWKRVAGNYVETWTLTASDMDIIVDGITEILWENGSEDVNPEQIELSISVYQTNQRVSMTLAELGQRNTAPNRDLPQTAYTSDDWTRNAQASNREAEISKMHPAYWPNTPPFQNPYQRKGVNPIGDWTIP